MVLTILFTICYQSVNQLPMVQFNLFTTLYIINFEYNIAIKYLKYRKYNYYKLFDNKIN